jgi:hypothetical protein
MSPPPPSSVSPPMGQNQPVLSWPLPLRPALIGGLVHRLDPAGADVLEHGRDEGGEQRRHRQHLLGEPRAADLDAGGGEPALQDGSRSAGASDGSALLAIDHRAHLLEHHLARIAHSVRQPSTLRAVFAVEMLAQTVWAAMRTLAQENGSRSGLSLAQIPRNREGRRGS